MFLDSIGSDDITLHVDTPGGSVKSGLGIVDVMDYIKCDVEGYEWIIFKELKPTIEKFLPIIQIEIDEKNLKNFTAVFTGVGYVQYGLANFKFIKENGPQHESGDFLYIHRSKEAQFLKRIQ